MVTDSSESQHKLRVKQISLAIEAEISSQRRKEHILLLLLWKKQKQMFIKSFNVFAAVLVLSIILHRTTTDAAFFPSLNNKINRRISCNSDQRSHHDLNNLSNRHHHQNQPFSYTSMLQHWRAGGAFNNKQKKYNLKSHKVSTLSSSQSINNDNQDLQAPGVKNIIAFAIPAIGIWLCGPLLSLIDTSAVGLLSGTAQQAALNPAITITEDGALLVVSYQQKKYTVKNILTIIVCHQNIVVKLLISHFFTFYSLLCIQQQQI